MIHFKARELKQQVEQLKHELDDFRATAMSTASDKSRDARQAIAGFYEDKKQRVMELEDELAELVRGRPIRSLLIAAGIGAVLGALWSPRR